MTGLPVAVPQCKQRVIRGMFPAGLTVDDSGRARSGSAAVVDGQTVASS